ncbi:hypothetical protein C8Q80DRAFT_411291 [Daedaleopsis nitida]|nr:hypothetical protein C8Q80DRAFT_411291 [Daedaleopsis nitida]
MYAYTAATPLSTDCMCHTIRRTHEKLSPKNSPESKLHTPNATETQRSIKAVQNPGRGWAAPTANARRTRQGGQAVGPHATHEPPGLPRGTPRRRVGKSSTCTVVALRALGDVTHVHALDIHTHTLNPSLSQLQFAPRRLLRPRAQFCQHVARGQQHCRSMPGPGLSRSASPHVRTCVTVAHRASNPMENANGPRLSRATQFPSLRAEGRGHGPAYAGPSPG